MRKVLLRLIASHMTEVVQLRVVTGQVADQYIDPVQIDDLKRLRKLQLTTVGQHDNCLRAHAGVACFIGECNLNCVEIIRNI